MGWLFQTAALVGLLAALPFLTDYGTRRAFPIPAKGTGVVITGASTGIGHDAAVHLANHGYRVYAGVRKDRDKEAIKVLAVPTLIPVILDVTDQATIDSAYDVITSDLEASSTKLTGLVNNAGITEGSEVTEFVDVENVQKLFNVNYFGVLRMVKKFLPLVRASAGRVINISSMAGFISSHHFGPYSSSKHALEAMSDALRIELLALNVSVSVVQPGVVITPILAKAEEAMKHYHPDTYKAYPHLEGRLKSFDSDSETAATTDVTNEAILHAFTDPYPKPRYPVAGINGVSAGAFKVMVQLIPTRLMDHILMDFIK